MNIVKWVKIISSILKASVLKSGFISEQFSVQEAVDKDILFLFFFFIYLFILRAEVFAVLVKYYKNIKGNLLESRGINYFNMQTIHLIPWMIHKNLYFLHWTQ